MYTKKLSKGANFSLYILTAAILALVFVITFGAATPAYADMDAGDAFEVVFPTANYFQSERPTFVAANESYLAVYDSVQSRLYVRGEDTSIGIYDLSQILMADADSGEDDSTAVKKPVADIYTVGSHALIAVGVAPDFEIYSIDLTDATAVPEQKDIPSPDHIDCFAGDGEKLYAKNAAGYVTSYDENMQVVKQDIYNYEVTPGQANIAVEDGVIYIFTTDTKNTAQLYIYDSNTDEVLSKTPSKFVQSAYIGDVIYAQITPAEEIENHSKIICLDKETGEELYTSNFMPESFCAYGDKLYSIEGGEVTGYRFKQTDGGEYVLEPEEMLSMTGGDLKHLDGPSDLISIDGALVIADSNNMRLAYIAPSAASALTYTLEKSPLRLTSGNNKVYALLEGGDVACFDISDGALSHDSTTLAAPNGDALALNDIVCYNTKLYAVDGSTLYFYIGDSFFPLVPLAGARRITVAKDGHCLYALTDDEIVMLSEYGERLPARLMGDFKDARDLSVDYAGNICVMYADRAEYFENDIYSLQNTATYPLSPSAYTATATSCTLDGDTLYFSAEENFVGKLNVDVVTDEGYIPPTLPTPAEATYHFAKLKDATSSYFIPASDGRADSVMPATSNVLLVLDAPAGDGLAYAMDVADTYIIRAEDYDDVPTTALDDKAYLMREEGTLYRLPYHDEDSIELAKGAQGIRAVSDCAGYDGNRWTIVRYNGANYFVSADLLEEDYAPPIDPDDPDAPNRPAEPKTVYGRAKASRVGGTVNIYSDISESGVLTRIVDGKKVEILATLEGYYQVRYGDTIGFMRAAEVKIGGLTTVQIVAIVLSIVVLLAGTGITLSIYTIKKRTEPQK